MLQGATLRLTPNWIVDTLFVDIVWDTTALSNLLPQGPWWGRLALLAGTGSNEDQWDWDRSAGRLLLWVQVMPQFPAARRLVGVLDQFTFPPVNGAKGTGSPAGFLPPTTQPLAFNWQVQLTMPATGSGP